MNNLITDNDFYVHGEDDAVEIKIYCKEEYKKQILHDQTVEQNRLKLIKRFEKARYSNYEDVLFRALKELEVKT